MNNQVKIHQVTIQGVNPSLEMPEIYNVVTPISLHTNCVKMSVLIIRSTAKLRTPMRQKKIGSNYEVIVTRIEVNLRISCHTTTCVMYVKENAKVNQFHSHVVIMMQIRIVF